MVLNSCRTRILAQSLQHTRKIRIQAPYNPPVSASSPDYYADVDSPAGAYTHYPPHSPYGVADLRIYSPLDRRVGRSPAGLGSGFGYLLGRRVGGSLARVHSGTEISGLSDRWGRSLDRLVDWGWKV